MKKDPVINKTDALKGALGDNNPGVTPPTEQTKPTHINHYQNEQRKIIRQVCIKAAASIFQQQIPLSVQPTTVEIDHVGSQILRLAEGFEEWINEPEIVKQNDDQITS